MIQFKFEDVVDMKNMMLYNLNNLSLIQEAEAIVRRSMTRLRWQNIDLIYAETDYQSITEILFIAYYLRQTCSRIVILTAQGEFTHLTIAKSANVSYLYVDEIVEQINRPYQGIMNGDDLWAQATFNQHDIAPLIIDNAVESIIVAMP